MSKVCYNVFLVIEIVNDNVVWKYYFRKCENSYSVRQRFRKLNVCEKLLYTVNSDHRRESCDNLSYNSFESVFLMLRSKSSCCEISIFRIIFIIDVINDNCARFLWNDWIHFKTIFLLWTHSLNEHKQSMSRFRRAQRESFENQTQLSDEFLLRFLNEGELS